MLYLVAQTTSAKGTNTHIRIGGLGQFWVMPDTYEVTSNHTGTDVNDN
jgi:hypothetical protein